MVLATVPNLASQPNRFLAGRFSPKALATHNLDLMSAGALAEHFRRAGLREVEAGACTGPFLLVQPEQRSRRGALASVAAKAWNAASSCLPEGALWDYRLYATGRSAPSAAGEATDVAL